jgi:hypothetical protein
MKNCSNCKWNVSNVCENSNWKDGIPISDPTKPECGYLTAQHSTPLGYSSAPPVEPVAASNPQ